MMTGSVIVSGGDALVQYAFDKHRFSRNWEWNRTLGMGSFGLLYVGLFNAWVYRKYLVIFARIKHQNLNLSARVLTDNFIHVPFLWLPTFYYWMGYFKGHEVEETTELFQRTFLTTLCGSWILWIPSTAFNFKYIPPQFRILFMCMVSFCDKIRLSYTVNRKNPIKFV